jgi:hypothetical protein
MNTVLTGKSGLSEFRLFSGYPQVRHGITARKGGVSIGKYSSLNLSFTTGDNPESVMQNRAILAELFSIDRADLFFPAQCHSSLVKEVTGLTPEVDLKGTDALITNQFGICIGVTTADCVPVLLFDPEKNVIAAIHAGWRGTTGRIVARAIERMVKKYHTRTADLLAGIGPSISQKNYEVGGEVAEKFKFWFADVPAIFQQNPDTGKTHIDLCEANRQLLLRYGVKKENIAVSGACTYEHPGEYFSARRDGLHSGRFASCIMLVKS